MIKTPAHEITVLFLDGPFSGQYRTGCIGKQVKMTVVNLVGTRVWTYGRYRFFAKDDATKPDMATATLLPSDLYRWQIANRRPVIEQTEGESHDCDLGFGCEVPPIEIPPI